MIFTALSHTLRDLGVAFLVTAAAFALLFALGHLVGLVLRGPQPPTFDAAVVEPEPTDLDDWLANEEPLEEFKVWKRPQSEVRVDRGVV